MWYENRIEEKNPHYHETKDDPIRNILAEVCYKYTKWAKEQFLEDHYFAMMFLIFVSRGVEFIDKRAGKHRDEDQKTFLVVVQQMKETAEENLKTHNPRFYEMLVEYLAK